MKSLLTFKQKSRIKIYKHTSSSLNARDEKQLVRYKKKKNGTLMLRSLTLVEKFQCLA